MTRKVAIIGAGIGAKHLDAYRSLSEHFTVMVMCDLNRDRARAVSDPHGIPV